MYMSMIEYAVKYCYENLIMSRPKKPGTTPLQKPPSITNSGLKFQESSRCIGKGVLKVLANATDRFLYIIIIYFNENMF